MTGQDIKRLMRQNGVSVTQMARYMRTTKTRVRKLQTEDSDYFYNERLDSWKRTVNNAAAYRIKGAYATV